MLRMGKLTDYATVVLASLAQEPARHRAAARIGRAHPPRRPTVSKVLEGAAARRPGDFLARCRKAAIACARAPEQITAAQILDAFEGPIAITECCGAASQCGIERPCRVGGAWQRVNAAIRRALEDVTLQQLAGLDSTARARRRASPRTSAARRPESPLNAAFEPQARRNWNPPCLANRKKSKPSSARSTSTASSPTSNPTPSRRDWMRTWCALISRKKDEPDFLLEWRLKALRHWLTMQRAALGATCTTSPSTTRTSPTTRRRGRRRMRRRASTRSTRSCSRPTRSWAFRCTSARASRASRSMRCSTASPSRRPSRSKLGKAGVIFCSFSEAVRDHPALIERYLGSVVPAGRQFLRGAELRGVHRRLLRLRAARACAARWSCRPTSASTRPRPDSSSAR